MSLFSSNNSLIEDDNDDYDLKISGHTLEHQVRLSFSIACYYHLMPR